jgi:hypothetical protein
MTFRTATAVILAGAIATASAQDLSKRISFSAPAGPAKDVVAELEKLAGFPLMTSTRTLNDILLVHVEDVPLGQVMDRIAAAAGARWEAESGGFRLVRPDQLLREQERQYLEARGKSFEQALARLKAQLDQMPEYTAEEARKSAEATAELMGSAMRGDRTQMTNAVRGAFTQGPAMRTLTRLLLNFDPAVLASIPPGSRVVFATNATRAQRPLPGNAAAVLAQFAREHTLLAEAQRQQPQEQLGQPGMTVVMMGPNQVAPIQGRLVKGLLIVSRPINGENLSVEFKAADETGNFVGQANTVITAVARPPEAAAAGSGETALELSQTAKEHFELLAPRQRAGSTVAVQGVNVGSMEIAVATSVATADRMTFTVGGATSEPPRELSDFWRERILNPHRYEPLSFGVSELFIGAAKAKKVNLVAALPDRALIALVQRHHNLMPSQLLAAASNTFGMTVQEEEGWLVMGPELPHQLRMERMDREAASRLLHAVHKHGLMRLDDLAAYAAQRPQPLPTNALDQAYLGAIHPGARAELAAAPFNWRTLRFYGLLSARQRQDLFAGRTLPFQGMSQELSAVVNSIVYDEGVGIMFEAESFVRVAATPGGARMANPMGRTNNLAGEITEALPNGVPRDGFVQLQGDVQYGLLARNSQTNVTQVFNRAEDYGAHLAMAQNPRAGIGGVQFPSFDRFRLMQSSVMHLQFVLGPELQTTKTLSDRSYPGNSQETTYERLPADVRAKIEEATDRAQRAFQNIPPLGQGRGGSQGPPPTP